MLVNPVSRTILPLSFVLLTALLWEQSVLPALSVTQLEDRIVAVVNTDLIMQSDVRRELAPEQERIRQQYRGEELEQRLKAAEYMALTKMIERRLQLQEAKAKSVDISDQEVKQAIQQMKQQGETVDEKDPLSLSNVRDQLTLLKVVDREVRNGVMVGDAEMKRYYKEHLTRFALPEEYTLSQILIQPRSTDTAAEALEKQHRQVAAEDGPQPGTHDSGIIRRQQ